MKDRKIMFKNRKKPTFKNYNKIIIESSTNNCRICCKLVFNLMVYLILFFGIFCIYGGYGVIRSNFFNPITLMVPYNFGTALKQMTILTTDGQYILDNYAGYSYEQFTEELRCAENRYSESAEKDLEDFVNSDQTVFCFFGFIYILLFGIVYSLFAWKLDLPTVIHERNSTKDSKKLYHYLFMTLLLPSLLFCFFYIYAIEYLQQIDPCFGL